MTPNGTRHRLWQHLQSVVGRLPDDGNLDGHTQLLVSLYAAGRLERHEDVEAVLAAYEATRQRLATMEPAA